MYSIIYTKFSTFIPKEMKIKSRDIVKDKNLYILFAGSSQFKNVAYEFADRSKVLFDNIDLKIMKNQCIGIVGSNGSGKSTFLNLLSGCNTLANKVKLSIFFFESCS